MILIYKGVLSRLTTSLNVQVLHAIYTEIKPFIEKLSVLAQIFETFGKELATLDNFLKKATKAFETKELVAKDAKRDFTVRAIIAKAQYCYTYAMTEEEKEDARKLVYITDKYKGVDKKSYEAETTDLRNLIKELNQVPHLLERFQLTGLVTQLQQENNDFEVLYNSRTQIVHEKLLTGTAKQYRNSANKAFDNLCKTITGISFIPLTDEEKITLENLIDTINAQIQQATIIYNRHLGVLAAQKKKKEEEEKQKTDIQKDEKTEE